MEIWPCAKAQSNAVQRCWSRSIILGLRAKSSHMAGSLFEIAALCAGVQPKLSWIFISVPHWTKNMRVDWIACASSLSGSCHSHKLWRAVLPVQSRFLAKCWILSELSLRPEGSTLMFRYARINFTASRFWLRMANCKLVRSNPSKSQIVAPKPISSAALSWDSLRAWWSGVFPRLSLTLMMAPRSINADIALVLL